MVALHHRQAGGVGEGEGRQVSGCLKGIQGQTALQPQCAAHHSACTHTARNMQQQLGGTSPHT
jgi:hypothetical protein